MDLFNQFLDFAGTEAGERAINAGLAVLAALAAFLLWLLGGLTWIVSRLSGKQSDTKGSPTYAVQDQAQAGFAEAGAGGIATGVMHGDIIQNQPEPTKLSVEEFIKLRRELKVELEAELAQADQSEQDQLRARIAELERQLTEPEKALGEAKKKIKDLEDRLAREANTLDPEALASARAALEKGDFSAADALFAEIEARTELEVQQAARAAFGRGEVAEAEIRWADASAHYAKAARLDPTYDTLIKASEYVERTGDYQTAARYSEDLVAFARANETQERLSNALNEHALNQNKLGQFAEAEGLYREALEIDRATIGAGHPDYAARLNNLALVVRAQGRTEEAEGLHREALEIGRVTIGEAHPDYATRLNNLAVVVQAQGRFAEAEGLYREALGITRTAVGEGHPSYAIRLVNLGTLLRDQNKRDDAREMLTQALDIFRATLPADHPNIATAEGHLASLDAVD